MIRTLRPRTKERVGLGLPLSLPCGRGFGMKETLSMVINTGFLLAGAFAIVAALGASDSHAEGPSMLEVAQRLYFKAEPRSFDAKCKGKGASLVVDGDRHTCTRPDETRIVRFEGGDVTQVTVYKKGIRKEALSQIKRKHGAADSVKTLGALEMHFWFTDDAGISLGFQNSNKSRSTMVSFRAPG